LGWPGDTGSEPTTATESPEPAQTVTVEAVPQDQLDAVAVREAELDEREAALDVREAAVTNAEEEAAANEITDGVWTVGVDVSAGMYAAQDVSADCYWAITRTVRTVRTSSTMAFLVVGIRR
jgi:hypothetical protein